LLLCYLFPYKEIDNPKFGNFPEWTDPWDRVVKGVNRGNGLAQNVDILQWAGGVLLTVETGNGFFPMAPNPTKGSLLCTYGRNTTPWSDYEGG